MEIKEFGQIIAREVGDVLGDGYAIECRDVLKNNGVVYHALVIRRDSESVAPTIYIDQMYEAFNKGSVIMGIVNEVVDLYRKSSHVENFDMDFFYDFSKVTDKLFFKVVNFKKNRDKLRDVPVKRTLDLALVPFCHYRMGQLGDGCIMIQNNHLKTWEITAEELWENVGANAPKLAPPKVAGLVDFIEKMTGMESGMDELCGIYVVSNKQGSFGAGTIFYPGVLKQIADDHECDLYVIPSSVHECIVIPDGGLSMDSASLRAMIGEVNRSTVAEEEILSDNLYMYDRDNDEFMIAKD